MTWEEYEKADKTWDNYKKTDKFNVGASKVGEEAMESEFRKRFGYASFAEYESTPKYQKAISAGIPKEKMQAEFSKRYPNADTNTQSDIHSSLVTPYAGVEERSDRPEFLVDEKDRLDAVTEQALDTNPVEGGYGELPSSELKATGNIEPQTQFEASSKVFRDTFMAPESGQWAKQEGANSAYDAVLGYGKFGTPDKPISTMTLGEIKEYQKVLNKAGGMNSSPVGKYQIVGSTFTGLVKEMGLNKDTVFTPELQDEMANRLLERRGFSKYLSGDISDKQFMINLHKEWESFGHPETGMTYVPDFMKGKRKSKKGAIQFEDFKNANLRSITGNNAEMESAVTDKQSMPDMNLPEREETQSFGDTNLGLLVSRLQANIGIGAGQTLKLEGERRKGTVEKWNTAKAEYDRIKNELNKGEDFNIQKANQLLTASELKTVAPYFAKEEGYNNAEELVESGERLISGGAEQVSEDLNNLITVYNKSAEKAKDKWTERNWTRGDLTDAIAQGISMANSVGDSETANKLVETRKNINKTLAGDPDEHAVTKVFGALVGMAPFMGKRAGLSAIPGVGVGASFIASANQGAGDVYADLKDAGADDETAKMFAPIAGIAYAGVEKLQLDEVSKLTNGATKEFKNKFLQSIVKKSEHLLASKGQKVAGKVLKGVNKAAGTKGGARVVSTFKESGEEGLQKAITASAVEASKAVGGIGDESTAERVGHVIKESLKEAGTSLVTFGTLEGFKGSLDLASSKGEAESSAITDEDTNANQDTKESIKAEIDAELGVDDEGSFGYTGSAEEFIAHNPDDALEAAKFFNLTPEETAQVAKLLGESPVVAEETVEQEYIPTSAEKKQIAVLEKDKADNLEDLNDGDITQEEYDTVAKQVDERIEAISSGTIASEKAKVKKAKEKEARKAKRAKDYGIVTKEKYEVNQTAETKIEDDKVADEEVKEDIVEKVEPKAETVAEEVVEPTQEETVVEDAGSENEQVTPKEESFSPKSAKVTPKVDTKLESSREAYKEEFGATPKESIPAEELDAEVAESKVESKPKVKSKSNLKEASKGVKDALAKAGKIISTPVETKEVAKETVEDVIKGAKDYDNSTDFESDYWDAWNKDTEKGVKDRELQIDNLTDEEATKIVNDITKSAPKTWGRSSDGKPVTYRKGTKNGRVITKTLTYKTDKAMAKEYLRRSKAKYAKRSYDMQVPRNLYLEKTGAIEPAKVESVAKEKEVAPVEKSSVSAKDVGKRFGVEAISSHKVKGSDYILVAGTKGGYVVAEEANGKLSVVEDPSNLVETKIKSDRTEVKGAIDFGKELADRFGIPKTLVNFDVIANADKAIGEIADSEQKKNLAINMNLTSGTRGFAYSNESRSKYLILLSKKGGKEAQLQTVAHEIGHIVKDKMFDHAPAETKEAILAEYNEYVASLKPETKVSDASDIRGGGLGNAAYKDSDMTMASMKQKRYFNSFDEWFAENTSRWAITNKKPKSLVDRFFKKVANALRLIYKKSKSKGMNQSFDKYMDSIFTLNSADKALEEISKGRERVSPREQQVKRKDTIAKIDFYETIDSKSVETEEELSKMYDNLSESGAMKVESVATFKVKKVVKFDEDAGKYVLTKAGRSNMNDLKSGDSAIKKSTTSKLGETTTYVDTGSVDIKDSQKDMRSIVDDARVGYEANMAKLEAFKSKKLNEFASQKDAVIKKREVVDDQIDELYDSNASQDSIEKLESKLNKLKDQEQAIDKKVKSFTVKANAKANEFKSELKSAETQAETTEFFSKGGKATDTKLDAKTTNEVVDNVKSAVKSAKNVQFRMIEGMVANEGASAKVVTKDGLTTVSIDAKLAKDKVVSKVVHEVIGHHAIDTLIEQSDPAIMEDINKIIAYDRDNKTDTFKEIQKLYPDAKTDAEILARSMEEIADKAFNANGTKNEAFFKEPNMLTKIYKKLKQFFHKMLHKGKATQEERNEAVNRIMREAVNVRASTKPAKVVSEAEILNKPKKTVKEGSIRELKSGKERSLKAKKNALAQEVLSEVRNKPLAAKYLKMIHSSSAHGVEWNGVVDAVRLATKHHSKQTTIDKIDKQAKELEKNAKKGVGNLDLIEQGLATVKRMNLKELSGKAREDLARVDKFIKDRGLTPDDKLAAKLAKLPRANANDLSIEYLQNVYNTLRSANDSVLGVNEEVEKRKAKAVKTKKAGIAEDLVTFTKYKKSPVFNKTSKVNGKKFTYKLRKNRAVWVAEDGTVADPSTVGQKAFSKLEKKSKDNALQKLHNMLTSAKYKAILDTGTAIELSASNGRESNLFKNIIVEGRKVSSEIKKLEQRGHDVLLHTALDITGGVDKTTSDINNLIAETKTHAVLDNYGYTHDITKSDVMKIAALARDVESKPILIADGIYNPESLKTILFKDEAGLDEFIEENLKTVRTKKAVYKVDEKGVVRVTSDGKTAVLTVKDGKVKLPSGKAWKVDNKKIIDLAVRMNLMNATRGYLNGQLADDINATSVKEHGYKLATNKTYEPRKTKYSKDALEDIKAGTGGTFKAIAQNVNATATSSFNKEREANGGAPLLLEDFFKSYLNHVRDTSTYVGAYDWFTTNKKAMDESESAFTQAREGDLFKSIMHSLDSVIGAREKQDGFTRFSNFLLGQQAVHVLAFNPKTMLMQTPSGIVAMTQFDKKYHKYILGGTVVSRTTNIGGGKKLFEEMQNIPVLRERLSELMQDVSGTSYLKWGKVLSTAGNKIMDLSIGRADWRVMQGIYLASKAEGKDKGLTGDKLQEFIEAKINQVISETQPDSAGLSKTQMQRSKNIGVRAFTVFSSQTTKNNQIMLKGLHDMRNGRVKQGIGKIMAAGVLNGLIAGLAKDLYDRVFTDKKYQHSTIDNLMYGMSISLFAMAPLLNIFSTVVINEIAGRRNFDKSVIFIDHLNNLKDGAILLTSDKKKDRKRGMDLIGKVGSSVLGVPLFIWKLWKLAKDM